MAMILIMNCLYLVSNNVIRWRTIFSRLNWRLRIEKDSSYHLPIDNVSLYGIYADTSSNNPDSLIFITQDKDTFEFRVSLNSNPWGVNGFKFVIYAFYKANMRLNPFS